MAQLKLKSADFQDSNQSQIRKDVKVIHLILGAKQDPNSKWM